MNEPPPRFCTSCGTQLRPGTAFCTACGASVAPPSAEPASAAPPAESPPEQPLPTSAHTQPPPTRSAPGVGAAAAPPPDAAPGDAAASRERIDPAPPPRNRKVLVSIAAVCLILLLGLGVFVLARGGDDHDVAADDVVATTTPPPTTRSNVSRETIPTSRMTTSTTATTRPAGLPIRLTPDGLTASATDANGTDDCQPPNDTSFAATNLVDGNNATAWRVDGNGTGATISVDFDRPTALAQVGLVPGYAKIDPCSGVDRFPQSYRIASVSYAFDDGTTVSQTFTDAPTLQTIPVEVTTSRILVTITGVSEPRFPIGSEFRREKTAISEMQFTGSPQ